MADFKEAELSSLLRRIAFLLDRLGLRYHLTGGIVSSYYGDPRYTQDIDIVILLQPEQAQKLVEEMERDFYINRESAMEAVREQGLFQALDNETYIKLDFHVGEGIPGELTRSREVSLFPGLSVRVTSIEDAIASKLRWIKLGSHRSREDVVGMLSSEHAIDFQLLRELCRRVSVEELLDELLESYPCRS